MVEAVIGTHAGQGGWHQIRAHDRGLRKSSQGASVRAVPISADCISVEAMKTFGTLISEARRAKGLSQKELASRVKKENGQPISAQYLNDIEHDRRNPPSEFLIGQIADLLTVSKDVLCIAAGTIPNDLQKMARTQPDKVEQAFKAFRRAVKDNK
jgi:transcriptional regulator with XRE-family HTH domain